MFFKVQVMPSKEVLARNLTIEEAVACMREYNESVPPSQSARYAAITECWGVPAAKQTPDAAQRADEILERAAAGYSAAGNNNVPEWQRSQRGW